MFQRLDGKRGTENGRSKLSVSACVRACLSEWVSVLLNCWCENRFYVLAWTSKHLKSTTRLCSTLSKCVCVFVFAWVQVSVHTGINLFINILNLKIQTGELPDLLSAQHGVQFIHAQAWHHGHAPNQPLAQQHLHAPFHCLFWNSKYNSKYVTCRTLQKLSGARQYLARSLCHGTAKPAPDGPAVWNCSGRRDTLTEEALYWGNWRSAPNHWRIKKKKKTFPHENTAEGHGKISR